MPKIRHVVRRSYLVREHLEADVDLPRGLAFFFEKGAPPMAGSKAARAHGPRSALAIDRWRTSESSDFGWLPGSIPRSVAILMIEIPRFSIIVSSRGTEQQDSRDPTPRGFGPTHFGWAHLRAGSYGEALASLERTREVIQETHSGFDAEPYAAAGLAEACSYCGEPDRALRLAKEAVTGARQRCAGILPFAQLTLARVLLRTQGIAARSAIEAALEETSRCARKMGLKTFDAFVCAERAELARLTYDETTRQRELREAHRLFLEMGAPIRAEQAAKELGL
jgi:hypothetical protein